MSRFRKNSSQSSISTIGGPFLRAGYDTVPLTSFFHLGVTPTSGSASLHYCYIAPPSRVATPDCDPSYGALDEPELPKESAWRTAYGAASMAVEITKGSSDMFPLLKAVTDALSVFTRNYDQTIANAEQMKDIGERVESLSELLTSPVGDKDTGEKTRRTALRKTLSGIIVKLEPLSNKRGLEEFLNNVDHANTLNGFVQDLANAVMDYQTSTLRNIDDNTKIQPNIYDGTRRDIHDIAKIQPNVYDDTRDIYDNAVRTGTLAVGKITRPGGAAKKAITLRRSFMRKVGRALAKLGRSCTEHPME